MSALQVGSRRFSVHNTFTRESCRRRMLLLPFATQLVKWRHLYLKLKCDEYIFFKKYIFGYVIKKGSDDMKEFIGNTVYSAPAGHSVCAQELLAWQLRVSGYCRK